MKKGCVLLLLACASTSFAQFDNLDDSIRYADRSSCPEVWQWNGSWVDPGFPQFRSRYHPTMFSMFFQTVDIFGYHWRIDKLLRLFDRYATQHKAVKRERPYCDVLTVKEGMKLVVFGGLYGAYHSLVRCLKELVEKKHLLDRDFRIVDPQCYLIFTGDVVNRSPYSPETLELVTLICERNPGRAYYLRGGQETDGHWEDFLGMRKLIDHYGADARKKLMTFFDLLPDGLELHHEKKPTERAYCFGVLYENLIPYAPGLAGTVVGLHTNDFLWDKSGLQMGDFLHGAPLWQVLSSPIVIHQQIRDFFCDAFVILEVGNSLSSSVITLYCQDVRKKDGFKQFPHSFSIGCQLPDKAAEKRVFEHEPLWLGASFVETGAFAELGYHVHSGLAIAIEQANNAGGIRGNYFIRPVLMDDSYLPYRAERNVKTMRTKFGIDQFILPTGTAPVMPYRDIAAKFDIAVFFPVSGAALFRGPAMKGFVHLKPSYQREAKTLVKQVADEREVREFLFVYQDDAYGYEMRDAAHEALRELGIVKWVDVPYSSRQITFKEQVVKIKSAEVEAIGFFMASSALAATLIDEIGVNALRGKKLFATSFIDTATFARFRAQRGLAFTFSSFVPDLATSDWPIIVEYRNQAVRRKIDIDTNSFEGYLAASLYCDALDHIGPPFTRERVMHYFESLKNYNFKGFVLTFDPQERSLSNHVWIKKSSGNAD